MIAKTDGHAGHHRRHETRRLRIAGAECHERRHQTETRQATADAERGTARHQPRRHHAARRQLQGRPEQRASAPTAPLAAAGTTVYTVDTRFAHAAERSLRLGHHVQRRAGATHLLRRRDGQSLEPRQPMQRIGAGAPAHFLRRLQATAAPRPVRCVKNPATHVCIQLDTRHARGLTTRHAGNWTGDGWRDATGTAAETAVHVIRQWTSGYAAGALERYRTCGLRHQTCHRDLRSSLRQGSTATTCDEGLRRRNRQRHQRVEYNSNAYLRRFKPSRHHEHRASTL